MGNATGKMHPKSEFTRVMSGLFFITLSNRVKSIFTFAFTWDTNNSLLGESPVLVINTIPIP